MQRRHLIQAAGALPLATLAARTAFAFDGPELYAGEKALYAEAQKEGLCVSFDTGPEWANWKSLFRDFKKRYPEIELTYNDIGSAATVVALEKTKRRPQADTAYYFAASAVDAAKKDVVAPFKPVNFDKLPAVFREAEGRWFTIHTLNIAFLVNKKLVKNVPTGWADLLKPEFKNTVVYLDPRSTGIGQVLTFAAAYANGGSVDNVQPGIDYLGKLHSAGNVLRVEGTTPYAKFLKGEIPVWISYENDGLKAKHVDGMGDAMEVVIPKEASVAAPYAISLVKNGPNPNAGKLWLNFIMSEAGQSLFAQGFVRPAVPGPGQVSTKARRNVMRRFGAWPAWAFMALFFAVPLAALLPEAFGEGGSAFGRLFGNPLFFGALRNTLALGLAAGAVSALVGTCIAIELARQPAARRQWMMTLLGLPLAFSGLVIAYGFILAFGRAGFVTQLLAGLGADPAAIGSWIYSVSGLGFAYAYYLIPRVALSLYPVFANLDLRPVQAARTLGASRARAFWDTVVPEVLPSVLSNACMVAAIAMGTYGTALALVGTQLNILPLMLLAQVGDGGSDFAVAAALSLVLMVVCVIVMGVGDVFTRRRERGAVGAGH